MNALAASLGPHGGTLASEAAADVRNHLLKYGVLAFPPDGAGDDLTESAFVDWFSSFGNPLPQEGRETSRGSTRHEIFHVTNMGAVPSNSPFLSDAELEWHSDLSYRCVPGELSCLHAKVLPPSPSFTLFADTAAACRALPPAYRQRLEGAMAIHRHPEPHMNVDDDQPVTMPIICTHPETGEAVLNVSPMFVTEILGVSPEESRELLQMLYRHVTLDQFVCHHEWQMGSTVLWDNRKTLHRREAFDGDRLLWRCQSRAPLLLAAAEDNHR